MITKHRSRKIKTKFSFFPTNIGNNTIWFEKYYELYEFYIDEWIKIDSSIDMKKIMESMDEKPYIKNIIREGKEQSNTKSYISSNRPSIDPVPQKNK